MPSRIGAPTQKYSASFAPLRLRAKLILNRGAGDRILDIGDVGFRLEDAAADGIGVVDHGQDFDEVDIVFGR